MQNKKSSELYDSRAIESRWQKQWETDNLYQAVDFDLKRKKSYVLVEFPYPSGDGLHVGHCLSYIAQDIVARWKRMNGENVLYPIGWDAFGLPAENYAIKHKIKPHDATKKNIENFTRQIKSLGISFDWSREINTTDPSYYRWTQWIFLQLYKKGLAEKKEMPINWCPSCKIGLAFEEVVDGKCERCGSQVTRRHIKQWVLKITEYADRLLDDLAKVDFSPEIKQQQINWIGRSEGADIKFTIRDSDEMLKVFTTRPDTLFGVTYLVVAPEHELIHELESSITNIAEVKKYVSESQKKTDRERQEQKEKTGVELKGIKAIHPATKEEIAIWVADYVLISYGSGAIMAVPAHDERDFEFAKKFKLPIVQVVDSSEHSKETAYTGDGIVIHSGKYDGLSTKEAIKKIGKDFGTPSIQYKLRDWIFSRQHYWGEPIPIIHCSKCGFVPVDEDDLPVTLPDVDHYEPTDTGESPLAKVTEWVNTQCPKCGGEAQRETDTMPNWAGSSWYFLRYTDPNNDAMFADMKHLKYWTPVDLYNGGAEHTTLHLLYSRFWHKFLYDIEKVPTKEPYTIRVHHGMILAPDGQKMSKSRGNVINPDEFVEKYGADTFRMYMMFMGEYDQVKSWNDKNLEGVKRFIRRIWIHAQNLNIENPAFETEAHEHKTAVHRAIAAINEDLERRSFNTIVSHLMECWNQISGLRIAMEDYAIFVRLLAPVAPHLAEELWQKKLGNTSSVHTASWPQVDTSYLIRTKTMIGIQVNGKRRGELAVMDSMTDDEVRTAALGHPQIRKYTDGRPIKKFLYIKEKIISIVV